MTEETKRSLQHFADRTNALSLVLFTAREEIKSLKNMVAFDVDIIEKLASERLALIERAEKLEAELQALKPVQELPAAADVNAEINSLLFHFQMYPAKE
jgi:predicted hotdog family 3-hydroxylacyl-ACP dehydratase